jgi:hypothetical protein
MAERSIFMFTSFTKYMATAYIQNGRLSDFLLHATMGPFISYFNIEFVLLQ